MLPDLGPDIDLDLLADIEHDTALMLESGLTAADPLVAQYIAILAAHNVPTPAPGHWVHCPIRGERFTYTSALAGQARERCANAPTAEEAPDAD